MMFFLCFLSYTPLAVGIDTMADNSTTTNAVWVFMDSFFGIFWTIFVIFWFMLALYFIIGEM
ncbi:hypothetical protein ES702_07884 [subsurface metagenome]